MRAQATEIAANLMKACESGSATCLGMRRQPGFLVLRFILRDPIQAASRSRSAGSGWKQNCPKWQQSNRCRGAALRTDRHNSLSQKGRVARIALGTHSAKEGACPFVRAEMLFSAQHFSATALRCRRPSGSGSVPVENRWPGSSGPAGAAACFRHRR